MSDKVLATFACSSTPTDKLEVSEQSAFNLFLWSVEHESYAGIVLNANHVKDLRDVLTSWLKENNHEGKFSTPICECGPLRTITNGGHFPACTRCKRRLSNG